jgi:hypothetical protein
VRPGDLDEQRDEGLRDRIRGLELDDFAAIRRMNGFDLNVVQIGRIVEALGGEGLARRERHLHRVDLVGSDVGDFNFRVQRGIERGEQMNVPEAEGKRC